MNTININRTKQPVIAYQCTRCDWVGLHQDNNLCPLCMSHLVFVTYLNPDEIGLIKQFYDFGDK